MRPSAHFQTSCDLLAQWQTEKPPADLLLQHHFRHHRYIGSKDKRAIAKYFYTVLRRKGELAWYCEQAGLDTSPRSLLLAVLVLVEKIAAEDVEGYCDGSSYGASPLTDAEKFAIINLFQYITKKTTLPFHAQHNIQLWMETPLIRFYGEECKPLLNSLEGEAPVDIRCNILKNYKEALQATFKAAGIDAQPTPYAPHGLRVQGRHNLTALPAFRDGGFEVQDEGSQLVAELVDAQPGMLVVDYCAGAGGKTLAMATSMQGEGRIIACDIDKNRLIRLEKRAERAGVASMIETRLLPAVAPLDALQDTLGKADRVLVDAPCSGSGTWRRNPDLRWRYSEAEWKKLQHLQASILQNACKLLQPAGLLIYATCSLFEEENDRIIEDFISQDVAYRQLAAPQIFAYGAQRETRGEDAVSLRLAPHTHETDGFFATIVAKR